MDEKTFAVTLALRQGYALDVDFNATDIPPLHMDEPPPLGAGRGPNASLLLAAAVGNCLSASLLFCLRKARIEPRGLKTTVEGTLTKDVAGRLRVGGLSVRLEPDYGAMPPERVSRCLEIFEDFCVVTESVRRGIDVEVEVKRP